MNFDALSPGIALMLKSLGFNPEEAVRMVTEIATATKSFDTRLAAVEQRLARIEDSLSMLIIGMAERSTPAIERLSDGKPEPQSGHVFADGRGPVTGTSASSDGTGTGAAGNRGDGNDNADAASGNGAASGGGFAGSAERVSGAS